MALVRLYLDSNIFIYAFENTDDLSEKFRHLIAMNADPPSALLATSELALAELIVGPLRRNNERLLDIYDDLTIGNAFVQIGIVSREVLWCAAILRVKNTSLRLPDAIHVATALLLGCKYLLSADMGLKDRYELPADRRLGRWEASSIDVIRPEAAVLDRLQAELTA